MALDICTTQDNPKVIKEMEGRARARHEEEMRKKADELGIDLSDPDVQKALELLEKERKMKEAGYDIESPLPTWRKWLVYAFDRKKIFNVQNAIYIVLAVRLLSACLSFSFPALASDLEGDGLRPRNSQGISTVLFSLCILFHSFFLFYNV